jgi:hypothetical protein
MAKILVALNAEIPKDNFQKSEEFIEQQIDIMQRDKNHENVVKSINNLDEQEISRSPEKFKNYKPYDVDKVNQTVKNFFTEEEFNKRDQLWKKREEMQRKVLNVIQMQHSFIYGLCETFSQNLDFVCRYIYQVFFMMQVAV